MDHLLEWISPLFEAKEETTREYDGEIVKREIPHAVQLSFDKVIESVGFDENSNHKNNHHALHDSQSDSEMNKNISISESHALVIANYQHASPLKQHLSDVHTATFEAVKTKLQHELTEYRTYLRDTTHSSVQFDTSWGYS